MRLKVYYQPDEIQENLYTFGNEWMLADTYEEYNGPYHQYLTGEVYTLSTYNSTLSKKLIPYVNIDESVFRYQQLRNDIKLTNNFKITSYYPIINNEDLQAGFITRYFVQKHNDSNVIEVNKSIYDMIRNDKSEAILYKIVQLKWYIVGNIEDTVDKTVKIPGIVTKNLQQIQIASKTIKYIQTKLNNVTEFYTDIDFVVPADINGLDS